MQVGDRIHDHGSRDQGRPPAAGRRVRDQVEDPRGLDMERAVKEENIAALKARPRQGDQPGPGRLPRHHRQERHRAAPRVPPQRLQVPGRQEHAPRHGRQGHAHGGDREAVRRARRPSPTRSRTRPPPPRSRPRSPRARRSSSSRAATSTARRWTSRASRRCRSCRARTSSARLSLHFGRGAPELPRPPARPPRSRLARGAGRARAAARRRRRRQVGPTSSDVFSV